MIEYTEVKKSVIRNHYDLSTLFYRLLWGPHIHHGYWEADESSSEAQIQLTRRLAKLAEISAGSTVYDIGCGMGGSSQWLARELNCNVTGVTLSPVQRRWAQISSAVSRVKPRPKFLCADAEIVELPTRAADYVWSIECTEHLFDKPAFFKRAASWLKPKGRFALCAWLAGQDPLASEQIELARQVCKGMFCPSLGTQSDYVSWFEQAGMKIVHSSICTRQVEKTWELCKNRVDRSRVRILAKLLGQNHVMFLDHFDAILNAYRSGAMEYGCFVAEKIE